MTPTETMDWWLQRTAVYGLAFVFTAGVLGIFLWMAVSVVAIAKKWVPMWFEASIAKQQRDSETLEGLEGLMGALVMSNSQTRAGLKHMANALRRVCKKDVLQRLGIDSDVIMEIESAQQELGPDIHDIDKERERKERYERRKRELGEQAS
jgi:hypothetical protein